MSTRAFRVALIPLATIFMVLGMALPLAAQETPQGGVSLVTPYLGVAVEPGDTTSFPLQVNAPAGEVVELAVDTVPEGWTARLRGGGFVVDRIMISEQTELDLEAEVTVPPDVTEGTYQVGVTASGAGSTDRLDLTLTVAEAVGGSVTLDAEFPALRGPSDVQFSYTLELTNNTGEEVQFGLQAQGPEGWQVSARPSGETRAASVTVAAGASEQITVEVDPPDSVPAGQYQVLVQAAGGGNTASAELTTEVTGTFDIGIVLPDERLNVDVQAGAATEVPLLVVNEGSAPLAGVSIGATPPSGWEVSFNPSSVDVIEPGASAEVTAVITPSSEAIVGDYRITMRANVPEAEDSVEVRATVETSALWGAVGIVIIVGALAALAMVFRRFGRR
ncbi:MAG TPA: NEW3 domain-containing protein [Acidimicrobiia bacterium]|jgi:uncharacterized membrane protein|nr:NEW3 domain-containing protein [Acidimicrobiia bacterium]